MIPKQFKNRKPKKPYLKLEKYRMRMAHGSIYMFTSEKIHECKTIHRSLAKRKHIEEDIKCG